MQSRQLADRSWQRSSVVTNGLLTAHASLPAANCSLLTLFMASQRIAVIGSTGQLGTDLVEVLRLDDKGETLP